MAITKLMNIKSSPHGSARHLFNSIRYIMNPEKTKDGLLVGGNSGTDYREVYRTMKDTKDEWGKPDGRQGYHFVISWKPGETDEGTAYQVVKEFCEEYLGGAYDYVFSVHDDQDHLHGHIVFNSVCRENGYKYRYKKGDWKKHIQPITDRICEKHKLEPLKFDERSRTGKPYAEAFADKKGKYNWSKIIKADIDHAIAQAESYPQFLDGMVNMGYQIQTRMIRGQPELALTPPGQDYARRTSNLRQGYTLADIQTKIAEGMETPNVPRLPKVKHCQVRDPLQKHSYLSRFQAKRVRLLHQTHNRFFINPYGLDQAQIRKNLLQIDRLREDCRYLIRMNIHNSDGLDRRESELNKEEQVLKAQRGICYMAKENEAYQRYSDLRKESEGTAAGDDRFEEMADQMEELEKDLPFGIEDNKAKLASLNHRLTEIRKEKRTIRHIRKGEPELKTVPDLKTLPRHKARSTLRHGRQTIPRNRGGDMH